MKNKSPFFCSSARLSLCKKYSDTTVREPRESQNGNSDRIKGNVRSCGLNRAPGTTTAHHTTHQTYYFMNCMEIIKIIIKFFYYSALPLDGHGWTITRRRTEHARTHHLSFINLSRRHCCSAIQI